MRNKWTIGLLCLGLVIGLAVTTVLSEPENKPKSNMSRPGNGPGPMMKQRPGPQREMKPMDDEASVNKDEIYAFLKEFDQERLEKLQRLEKENPELFMRVLQEAGQRLRQLKELKERDPARFEQIIQEQQMEKNVRELVKKYRGVQTADEKEIIKKDMRGMLDKIFELKESQREAEVKKLEEQVNKLKEKMKKRKANRDKIIDHRIKILTGEEDEDDLGW